MAKIIWEDRFSVGNEKIDSQHKSLVDLINKLEEIEQKGGQLSQVFEQLDNYVQTHFREEEKLLQLADYDDLEAHKLKHQEFETWLHSVKVVYKSAGPNAHYITATVNHFLQEWLVEHILKSDMAYKGHI